MPGFLGGQDALRGGWRRGAAGAGEGRLDRRASGTLQAWARRGTDGAAAQSTKPRRVETARKCCALLWRLLCDLPTLRRDEREVSCRRRPGGWHHAQPLDWPLSLPALARQAPARPSPASLPQPLQYYHLAPHTRGHAQHTPHRQHQTAPASPLVFSRSPEA